MPSDNPRLKGVLEHFDRVRFFRELAATRADATDKQRLMLAAIYSCRAIVELMLEASEKQEVAGFENEDPKHSRETYELHIQQRIPYYFLIERIRIHDFHRFGLTPADPNAHELFFGGPAKVIAQKGSATLSITNKGPDTTVTGSSRVKLQRPLIIQNGLFFDDELQTFVGLDQVLKEFLGQVAVLIAEFQRRVK